VCRLLRQREDAIKCNILSQNVGEVVAAVIQFIKNISLGPCDKPELNALRRFRWKVPSPHRVIRDT
jgi:hypothetical protein